MNFIEAIDSVLLKNYFNLDGKATRSEYWWFCLFYYGFYFSVAIVAIAAILAGLTITAVETAQNYFLLGLTAAFFLPFLGLTVRRFADAGRGKIEAIVVFVLFTIASLIQKPVADGAIAIIQVPAFFSEPAENVFIVTWLYTIYIAPKKSV